MVEFGSVAVGLVVAIFLVDDLETRGRLIAIGVFVVVLLASSLFQRAIPPVDIVTVTPEEFSRKRSVLKAAMAVSVFAAVTALAIGGFCARDYFFR